MNRAEFIVRATAIFKSLREFPEYRECAILIRQGNEQTSSLRDAAYAPTFTVVTLDWNTAKTIADYDGRTMHVCVFRERTPDHHSDSSFEVHSA